MKIYNQTGMVFKRFAFQRKDFKVEEKLDNGIIKKQISFTYPLEDGRIYCEEVITYEGERYRVKEAPVKGWYGSVVAAQDTDALSGHCIENFTASGMTLGQCVQAALEGTGWIYRNLSADNLETRNITENNTDSMKILERIAEIFWVEMDFLTASKTVHLYSRVGNRDSRARFIKGFNLKALEVKTDTHDFYTRIYPIGKDSLRIGAVNGNKDYLDNTKYSGIIQGIIWEDTNYTDVEELKRAAKKKLEELSVPKTTYTAQVLDVANIQEGYEDFRFSLGDEADVIEPDLEVKARERIVSITRYPDHPEKNTVQLANRSTSFSDMQKKLLAAADAVSSVTNGKMVLTGKMEGIKAEQIAGLEVYATGAIKNLEIDDICK